MKKILILLVISGYSYLVFPHEIGINPGAIQIEALAGPDLPPVMSAVYTVYCIPLTTLTASLGGFSDGSGELNYGNDSDCAWLIAPPGISSISLSLYNFSTEADSDVVNVYDGQSNADSLLGSFSGDTIPPLLTSSGGYLYVEFITDDTVTGAGWDAFYTSSAPLVPLNIIRCEYWFDEDYAEKIVSGVSPSGILQFITDIPTPDLEIGLHRLQIRFQDEAGYWSSIISQFFYKLPLSVPGGTEIVSYEYWFDQDYDERITEEAGFSETYHLIAGLPADDLEVGLHTIQMHFKDNNGNWSSVIRQFFYKVPENNILPNLVSGYRYWFDLSDPEMTTVILDTPVNPLYLTIALNTCLLSLGQHSVHFQFSDINNNWSAVLTDNFNILPPSSPVINADGPNSFCEGGSLVLSAGPAESYLWSTGDTTAQITVTSPGDYFVTTVYSCGDTMTSAIFTVTEDDPTIPGSVSGGTTITIGYPTDTLRLTGNNGIVIKWQKQLDDDTYTDIPSTSGKSKIVDIPASSGAWNYRSVVQNGQCNVEFSEATTVQVLEGNITRTWTGAVDDDWNKAGNWSPSGIPLPIDDVIISGSAPHMPVVKIQGLSCHDLTIHPDATVTIIPGMTLTVNGNVILDN